MDIKSLITIDKDIQGGQPVFAGTRVPVESLFDQSNFMLLLLDENLPKRLKKNC